ncbi:DNA excision repair protein ERCC-1 [Exaiptasia diaphana]|nr:DNA excision repair protein ERCC-1 [Exaiptasia diaphana]
MKKQTPGQERAKLKLVKLLSLRVIGLIITEFQVFKTSEWAMLQDCLTTVKGINKTDVLTLSSTFGTLAGITSASQDDLTFLPGFGEVKASRLQNILHEPFLVKNISQADNKT